MWLHTITKLDLFFFKDSRRPDEIDFIPEQMIYIIFSFELEKCKTKLVRFLCSSLKGEKKAGYLKKVAFYALR